MRKSNKSGKFIPMTKNSHTKQYSNDVWFPKGAVWQSGQKYMGEQKTSINWKEKFTNEILIKKSVDEVSFTDIYELPLHQAKYSTWVWDAKGNFVFQFEWFEDSREQQTKIIQILNDEVTDYKRQNLIHKDGEILQLKDIDGGVTKEVPLMLIRGWGNLTGSGSYNMPSEYACKIQDSFAEFIISKLSINGLSKVQ